MKNIKNLLPLCALIILTACTPNLGGDDYDVAGVGEISRTSKGVIVSMRKVKLHAKDPSKAGTGAIIGAATGGALASTIGKGRGSVVAGTLGALAAGFAGHYLEQKATEQFGYEYTVRLDKGAMLTIAQGLKPAMRVGQRILLIEGGRDSGRLKGRGRSRIVPDHGA